MTNYDPNDRDRDAGWVPRRDPDAVPGDVNEVHRRAAFGTRPGDVPMTEHRRRSPARWLIPLLLVLALVPLLARLGDRGERRDVAGRDDPAAMSVAAGEVDRGVGGTGVGGPGMSAGIAGSIERFIEWAEKGGNEALPVESEENHPYTSQGIRLLADALTEATRVGTVQNAAERVREIRAQADRLQRSSGRDEHAEHAHAAFTGAARLIAELRAGGDAAASNGSQLMAAARAIEPGEPLSPQGEQVRQFFRKAAAAMEGLPTGR
jgi:hypothetical protein